MLLDRAAVKADAKQIMRGANVSPYIFTLLLMAIVFILERVSDLVEGGSLLFSYQRVLDYYAIVENGDIAALQQWLLDVPENTGITFFFSVIVSLISIVLNGGYYIYCMGIRRGAEMPYSTLADGLGVAGKLIWCSILMAIKIFLWALLFWVPGIIAAYRYRFAVYNILTDNSLSAGDAIRLSCQQTQGMKGQLFILDLSFIGWMLLSAFTFGLLGIWLTPYMTLCDIAYFEEGQRRVGRGGFNGNQEPPVNGDPWGQM